MKQSNAQPAVIWHGHPALRRLTPLRETPPACWCRCAAANGTRSSWLEKTTPEFNNVVVDLHLSGRAAGGCWRSFHAGYYCAPFPARPPQHLRWHILSGFITGAGDVPDFDNDVTFVAGLDPALPQQPPGWWQSTLCCAVDSRHSSNSTQLARPSLGLPLAAEATSVCSTTSWARPEVRSVGIGSASILCCHFHLHSRPAWRSSCQGMEVPKNAPGPVWLHHFLATHGFGVID